MPLKTVKLNFLIWISIVLVCISCSTEHADGSRHGSDFSDAVIFTDITKMAGLGEFKHVTGGQGLKWFPETMGAGGGVIDYNNNGWPDLLLLGGGDLVESEEHEAWAIWLYRNNGDGTFTLQTEEAGLADVTAYGFGVAVGDFNNTGWQDFYVTAMGHNMLFRNDGGMFTEVGEMGGVAGEEEWSTSAIFFDAGNNGWLDLYVGNYVEWSVEDDVWCTNDGTTKSYCTPEVYSGVPGRFYRNNRDGTFTELTNKAGFGESPGMTLGVTATDINRNGFTDLIVANDLQRDLLYLNNGDGTFTESGMRTGIAYDDHGRARAGMGIDVGDIDNSGGQTVFIGNFSDEMVGAYRYRGNELFRDEARRMNVGLETLPTLTFGLFLFDVNNNGLLDLFLANGHVHDDIERVRSTIGYRQAPQLFVNNGDGTFEQIIAAPGDILATPLVARGAFYVDFNRDGKTDIVLVENGGPVHLWRNDSDCETSYLSVTLSGVSSNRDGVGARIRVVAGDHQIERHIKGGSSYLSQSELKTVIGLDGATRADSVVVFWPRGNVDILTNIPANLEIEITEGSDVFTILKHGSAF